MLAVWLPLNGDINNQGVSSLTKTAGTPQYKAGKIGQGLDLNSRVTFSCPDLAGTTKFTVAFWVMLENNTNLSTNWQDIISFTDQKSDNSAIGYLRAETCYLSSYNPNYYGVHWHDNATYAMSSSTSTLPTHYKGDRGVWHHCVMTFDSEGMATGYTDGVLIGSYSNNNAGGHLTGAFWLGETNNIAGCINDVRIYKDQILSEQEIKKLSQGLVLHLPLSRKGFGLDNYLRNSTGHDGKTNWSGEVFVGYENGSPYFITKRIDTTSTSRSFINAYPINPDITSWQSGAKFTLSGYYKIPSTETYDVMANMFIRWYRTSGTADTGFYTPQPSSSSLVKDKWIYFNNTYEVPTNYEGGTVSFTMAAFAQGLSTVYWKNIKLELGEKPTTWTPNPLDPLFNQLNIPVTGTNLLPETTYGMSHWTHTAPNYTQAVQNGGKNTYICNQSVSGWWENVYSPAISVTSGKTYTLSCLYKVYSNFSLRSANDKFGLCVQNATPTNSNPSGNTIATILFGNANTQYVRGSVTFTPSVNTIYLNIPGGYIGDGQYNIVVDVDYIKLEEGSIVTPWNPDANIAYDISGYQHNATTNNITYSADTVINDICSVFSNSTTSYIKVEDTTWMVNGSTAMTVNVWGYETNWASQTSAHFFSCTESGGFNTEAGASGYLRFPRYVATNSEQTTFGYQYNNTGLKLADLTAGWHMLTFVYTLTGEKIYVDGVLHSEASYTSYGLKFNKNARLFLGCEAATGNPSSPYFTGMISDFRLYYTELSSDEILDLYERRG